MNIEDIRTKEQFEGTYVYDNTRIAAYNDYRLRLCLGFNRPSNEIKYFKKHQYGVFRVTGGYYSTRNMNQSPDYDQFMEIISVSRADSSVVFREIPDNFEMLKLFKRGEDGYKKTRANNSRTKYNS